MRTLPLLLVLLTVGAAATPALASDTSGNSAPGLDPAVGFLVALVVLAVVATVYALVHRSISKRKQDAQR